MRVFPVHIGRPTSVRRLNLLFVDKICVKVVKNGFYENIFFFFNTFYRPQWKQTTFSYDRGPKMLSHKIIINKISSNFVYLHVSVGTLIDEMLY